MKRAMIYYDRTSGILVRGLVWRIEPSLADADDKIFVYAEGTVIHDGKPEEEEIRNCPVNPKHVTELKLLRVPLEVYGNTVGDFVHAVGCGLIVSERFRRRLMKTDLTGYEIKNIVKIVRNEKYLKGERLFSLDVTGKGGKGLSRWRVKDAPNLCPHCKKEPMVCPGCGRLNTKCFNCGQWAIYQPQHPEYSHLNGFLIEDNSEFPIIEAKEWDGSDWFRSQGPYMVSNRAKEWMEKTHTFPVEFKPALLNIEGVEDKFEKEEIARGLIRT